MSTWSYESSFRRSTPLFAAVLCLTLGGGLAGPLAAFDPNHPVGVDPERALQVSAEGIDHVDLYSGSLSVTIPIGPFVLTNASNVWHYRVDPKTGDILARPDWERTGGIGWHLGWGEIYHPNHGFNETGEWLYVDESGSRHTLYGKLHRDDGSDGDTNNKVFYSRDGSYLRMRLTADNCHAYIEDPGGTTRRFTGSCGPGTTYRLRKVWSAFASEGDPDLTITYGVDPADPTGTEDTLRTVTNRYGLTHKIHLSDKMNGDPNDPVHWVSRIVTRVDVEGFAGQRSVYDFTYRQIQVNRSCKATTQGRISVPHLERVDLPDGTSYSMVEGDDLLYENLCRFIDGVKVDDLPGVLTGINLPTGGKIRWGYQNYEFPADADSSPFDTGAGIKTRSLHPAGAAPTPSNAIGTWTYKSTKIPDHPSAPNHPEMHTEVVYPTGDCSKHYFDAVHEVDPPWGWERGLPFVYSEEIADRYLSSQVFTGSLGNGSCDPATKIRSTYLRYRHDTTPSGSAPQSEWINTNRQVEASRTVFHDDGNQYVDTEYSDFDGLGNFRLMTRTSDLWGTQERQVETDYSRSSGTYPGKYTALPITAPWILGVFDSVEVYEPGAVGVQTVKTEYSFEDATGFLSCMRILASGTARGPADLLTVQTRDPLGRVLDSKLYGGDEQTLATTGGACGTAPSQPVYWTSHEYDPLSGARTRTWPRYPDGTYGTFATYDVDVEPRTGLVIRERDTAGFETTYDYDEAFRLRSATPQQGAGVLLTYVNATPGSQAMVRTTLEAPGSFAGPKGFSDSLMEFEVFVDDFGRPSLERQKLPGGIWSERETAYNGRGWMESVSQWGDLAKTTQYLDFDPFGRPGIVRPPDGSAHDLEYDYLGQRSVLETFRIALAGGETPVTRVSLYDGFGRLRRVQEPSGTNGTPEETDYSYDAAGLLTRVDAGVQSRHFTYDGRGLLLAERHPEKGPAGNGTVTYEDYDASGLPGRMTDGPNDLSFTYDFLGRLHQTRDLNRGSQLVVENGWDGAPGLGGGKLHYALRVNNMDLPWNVQGEEEVVVKQTFAYQGLGGAPSAKTTSFEWSSDDVSFTQTFGYDDLGNVDQFGFPACTLPAACTTSQAGSGPQVSYQYDQGVLAAVPGWVSAVSYNPSGLWQRIDHSNGVADHQDSDPAFSRRPRRLYTTGTPLGFDSGTMSYDGAGNLKAMGSDLFAYDSVSRLVDSSYGSGDFQGFSYDRWGNLTSLVGDTTGMVIFPVESATNRLVGAGYDGAGNMVEAPSYPGLHGHFAYDTANRVTSQNTMRYLYDAFGERAMSMVVDQEVEGGVFHLRDLGQHRVSSIRRSDATWTRERDYVFAGDRLIGRTSSQFFQSVRHFHLDHLGSVRLSTRGDGSRATQNHFMPYGERLYDESTDDSFLFAGPHERDFSADTDYLHARHYWWKLGRFLSPDPVLGSPLEPQTWNRYAYVSGNPLNYTDPLGLHEYRAPDEEQGESSFLLLLILLGLVGSDYIEVWGGEGPAPPPQDPRRPSVSPFPGVGAFTGFGSGGSGGSGGITVSQARDLAYIGIGTADTLALAALPGAQAALAAAEAAAADAVLAETLALTQSATTQVAAETAAAQAEAAAVQAARQRAVARAAAQAARLARISRLATVGGLGAGVASLLIDQGFKAWDARQNREIASLVNGRPGDASVNARARMAQAQARARQAVGQSQGSGF